MSQLTDQLITAHLEAAPPTSDPLVLSPPTHVTRALPAASTPRRVSLFEQISINVYTFAGNFQWQSLMAIVIPSLVVKFLGGANKDINLAMVVIWGTLVGFAVNPLVGAISDYATFRLGRRRPFLIVGTIFNLIALVHRRGDPATAAQPAQPLRLYHALPAHDRVLRSGNPGHSPGQKGQISQ